MDVVDAAACDLWALRPEVNMSTLVGAGSGTGHVVGSAGIECP